MPTYDYQREDGTVFEYVQPITDDPLTECPTTGQKVKRVFLSAPKVEFKGQGWDVHRHHRRYTIDEDGDAKQRRENERAKRRGRYVVTAKELSDGVEGEAQGEGSPDVSGQGDTAGSTVEHPTVEGDDG